MARSDLVGDRFQRGTEYRRGGDLAEKRTVRRQPPLYKEYAGAKTVTLERPETRGGAPVWEVITARRSERDFSAEPIAAADLSRLLWASQGITAREGGEGLRAAPSAGALYPVETYVVAHRVAGVEPGAYHYGVEQHHLEQVRGGDLRKELREACLGQEIAGSAAAVFIWSAWFDRGKWKYGQRAYRYLYLDAGHIGGNLALAAVALGLGSCPIGAYYDDAVNEIIDVDGETESAVYLTAAGKVG